MERFVVIATLIVAAYIFGIVIWIFERLNIKKKKDGK